jgi:hypothetical protein
VEVTPEWLVRRVEDAPTDFDATLPDRAALRARMAWQKLKRNARPGDELWAFQNPQSTWRKLGKRRGYALVREGVVVESVVTVQE